MRKISQLCVAALAALALTACDEDDRPSQPLPVAAPDTHQTAMGFTPWPADLTADGVDRAYEFLSQNGNLIAHHFDGGIPWDEALTGDPFPQHLRNDWQNRQTRTPNGFKTLVAITPLNFDRDNLASAWTNKGENQTLPRRWASRSLDDASVKKAYLNYAERVVEVFDPDFFAIGIEANIMISKSPEKWQEYLALNAHVYRGIKRKYPDLPVFTSVQYEHLRGIEDEAKPNLAKQAPAVRELMRHSDLMALSTYRFGDLHPNPMTADYFDVAESFGKPIAIAESGAMSKPVRIFGIRLPANERGQAAFVGGLLDHAAEKDFPFVVNWVAVDFDPMIPKLPSPLDEIAKAWVHTGLQNADGDDKQALSVWRSYLDEYED
ncbi:glycosyl hydrolase 53 family protein [Altererythrobacter lutimaris]|uniref:Glycosyl hydrolase 53 family protein n=1 Tax=Altererythrobacter lutimaris TaxID=2743979 RepID=A0A850HDE7_9SPHN|nr:glycosyl hydrolase 53 family protein [Altererythrobacter lutimaris]NVE95036.1 glycosyl hydrolase 53 family protein [Altererythrobacter lutimaris]